MIHFDSFVEKINKQENIFNQKISKVLFSGNEFSEPEKKELLEQSLGYFKEKNEVKGYFFSLLALSEVYKNLSLYNLQHFKELEVLSDKNNL